MERRRKTRQDDWQYSKLEKLIFSFALGVALLVFIHAGAVLLDVLRYS